MKINKSVKFFFDTTTFTDSYEIANHFSNYFVNVRTDIVRKIHFNIDHISYATINRCTISISYFEETEVLNALFSLKNSSQLDMMVHLVKLWNSVHNNLSALIYSKLFNFRRLFSRRAETGRTTNIFKSDDKKEIENVRPIYIIPLFEKLLLFML